MKTKLIAGLALLLAACGDEEEPKSLVHDLTILGVRAEPPEGAPGATVTLDALVADPNGAGRPVDHAWFVCAIDPQIGTAACDDDANLAPIGAGASITVTLPDVLAQIPAEMRMRGVDVFFALRATAGDETSNVAIKRVRVSENPAANTNPALERFDMDAQLVGGSFMVEAGADVELYARVAGGAHDEYVDDLGAPATEEMKFAWFLTAGLLENEITWEDEEGAAQTTYTAPDSDGATLWVVLRDGRGGIDWRTMQVEAQ